MLLWGDGKKKKFESQEILPIAWVDGEILYFKDDEGESKADLGRQIFPYMKPEEGQRLMFNINSPSGVGKSVLCAKFAKVWKLLNGKGKIFVFAPAEDKAFSGLGVNYVGTDIFLDEEEIVVEEFKNPDGHRTLIIFDDMGNVDDDIKKMFYKFQKRLLEQSRKHKIDIIIIGHRASDSNVTKYVLSEMTHFVVFNGYYDANIKYTLNKKMGVSNDTIKYMDNRKLFGRYTIVSKFVRPLYLMGEKFIDANPDF